MELLYIGCVNILACVLTVWDKRCARRQVWRVSEATLWTVAALGGAGGMFLTMRCVRHKTRRPSFMVGLPLLVCVQIAVFTFFTFYH